MTKIFGFVMVSIGVLFCAYIAINYISLDSKAAVQTQNVDLQIDVKDYLSFTLTGGASIDFGAFNPGVAACSNTATVASVLTNSANGYTLGVGDSSDANSALHKGSVYIADYAGTIAEPTPWTGTGLALGMFAADSNKEEKWGTGTTVCDASNKYAGVPSASTVAHTVTGFHETADTSSWSWKIDAPLSQETGAYTGIVVFTATTVLT